MLEFDLAQIKDSIESESQFIYDINDSIRKVIIGQDDLIEKLLLAILTDGHVFLEGVPGLAKTLTIKSLAQIIDTKFQRLQFTPDLLPADILGTLIYNPKESSFEIKKGPIFANIILADEINRSPAKVQSALLEAMQERQITIGDETFKLDFASPYGCSKGSSDQYVRDYSRTYKLKTVVLRLSCVYGPNQWGTQDQGWICWFIKKSINSKILVFPTKFKVSIFFS